MHRFPRIASAIHIIAGAALALILALTVTTAAPRTASASTPRCATSELAVWLGIGDGTGAAGSTYYPMEFTNVSDQTCQLYGFPDVWAYYNGGRVGTPARSGQADAAPTVTLKPGATAHTVLQIVNVAAFPSEDCVPVTASALQVYPPEQNSSAYIPFSFPACSLEGTVFMSVQAIQPGVGVPGY
jgi:hypothetical protein